MDVSGRPEQPTIATTDGPGTSNESSRRTIDSFIATYSPASAGVPQSR